MASLWWNLLAATSIACAACGGSRPAQRLPITLIITGTEGQTASVRGSLARQSGRADLHFAELPTTPAHAATDGAVEENIAAARHSYVNGEFETCVQQLEVDSTALLGARRRDLAARALFWRVACHVGAGDRADAEREVRTFAVLGLDVPAASAAKASPEVDRLFVQIKHRVAAAPRVRLRVVADVPKADVAVDGQPVGCTTPCDIDLPAGDHVVEIQADGVNPEVKRLRVSSGTPRIEFSTVAAPPELAAKQWALRYARSPAIDSGASVRLLARAVPGRRLVLLCAEPAGKRVDVRGVLALDGQVAARASRSLASTAALPGVAPSLLDELLVKGDVVIPPPPLHRKPVFWIAVGAAALIAAGTTGYLLYEPGHRQEILVQ